MPNIKIYRKTPKAGVKMISDLASRSYKGFLFECRQFWQFFTVTKILGGQSKFPQTQPWESKLLRVTAPCLRWYKSKVITIDGLSSLETWKYSVFHARKHQKKKKSERSRKCGFTHPWPLRFHLWTHLMSLENLIQTKQTTCNISSRH